MPPKSTAPTEAKIQPAGLYQEEEIYMGMVMVKCPQTGRAIPTGITIDRESFQRSPVFFRRTRCPICNTEHAWFAREAWVDEPNARVSHSGLAIQMAHR
jgi:adenine-specific DNA methylase